MHIQHINSFGSNKDCCTFKLGDDYIVVETNTGTKEHDFQNQLIVEELVYLEETRADVSLHNIREIVDKFRQTTVLFID